VSFICYVHEHITHAVVQHNTTQYYIQLTYVIYKYKYTYHHQYDISYESTQLYIIITINMLRIQIKILPEFQWCCEWFWLRYHIVAIWLEWWDIYLDEGHVNNLNSSLIIITLDRGEASEVTDLLLKSCAWSKVRQRHQQKAIDEPTWSDGPHSW
jgi:hypothetical protein